MVPNLSQINGISSYTSKQEGDRTIYFKDNRAFLVINKNTLEVRCDEKLAEVLKEQYESVMKSRYFGHGGIEIVPTNQLSPQEIEDLIRLSYNLTRD